MIDIMLFVAYFVVVFIIAYYSMGEVKTFKDYAVAGRSMPYIFVFASAAATIIGGSGTMGRVNYGYNWGILLLVLSIGSVLNQLLTGFFISPKMRALADGRDVYTIADIMDYYYGKAGHIIGAFFTFLYTAGVFGAQVLAMGKVLEVITGLPLLPMSVVATVFVIGYTWAGGMKAVIYTDLLQFIILAIGLTLASFVVLGEVGGIKGMVEGVAERAPQLLDWTAGHSGIVIFSFFLTWMFGEFLAPYTVARYMTADSPRNAKRSIISLGLFYGFWCFILFTLAFCGVTLAENADGDKVLIYLIQNYLPAGLVGLCFAGLIAALMSTADSLLNVAAVIYTNDIHKRYINKDISDKKMLQMTKTTTIIIGVMGIIIATMLPDIIKLKLYIYALWAPSMIVPLVACIVTSKDGERKVSPYAALPAILAGIITFVIFKHFIAEPPLPPVFASMLCNLIVFISISAITRKKKPAGWFLPNDLTTKEEV